MSLYNSRQQKNYCTAKRRSSRRVKEEVGGIGGGEEKEVGVAGGGEEVEVGSVEGDKEEVGGTGGGEEEEYL